MAKLFNSSSNSPIPASLKDLKIAYPYAKRKSTVLRFIKGIFLSKEVIVQLKGGTSSERAKQEYDASRWVVLGKQDAKLIVAFLQSVFDI